MSEQSTTSKPSKNTNKRALASNDSQQTNENENTTKRRKCIKESGTKKRGNGKAASICTPKPTVLTTQCADTGVKRQNKRKKESKVKNSKDTTECSLCGIIFGDQNDKKNK